MREYIMIIVVFAVLLFGTPVVFASLHQDKGETDSTDGNHVVTSNYSFPKKISLYLVETEDAIELSIEDYLIGCLFAQIPIDYHEQALKSQAVAAHTYLLRLMLDGVEISDDPTICQPFFAEEKAREHYGEEYESYLEKVSAAAKYGAKRVILYDDNGTAEPIYSVYHSISAGVTNTAYTVWGQDFPYLKSVESSWDSEHPNYLCVNELTAETIRLAIYNYNKTASMPVDYSLWFVNPIKNNFGYVISVKSGDTLLSGGDMWRIFNLRSTSFEVDFRSGEIFVFETRGYGHGVGLSQYGADVLANRGFTCEEILQHYYTDVTITAI